MLIINRVTRFTDTLKAIEETEGGLNSFTLGYKRMGFNSSTAAGLTYREWAPNAVQAFLVGDFSKRERERERKITLI